ncbi:MAG TPA: outer membrane protein assembly factor BamB [Gallionella sp.]|nr:outer membrane protein assembly factor BamB [Gallionella sp.]
MTLMRLMVLLMLLGLGGCSTIKGWFGSGNKIVIEPAKLTEFKRTASFAVRWSANIGDSGSDFLLAALSKDAIYAATSNGKLVSIDASSGKQKWQIETGIRISGGTGDGEGLVLVGSDKGDVLAYQEDGKLRWKSKVSSEVLSAPQAADGVVIVRSGDGHITGLSAEDGKQLWVYERITPALVVRSNAGVTVLRGVAYAGFAGGKLVAINIKNGEVLWEAAVSQPTGNTELERISDITSNPMVDDEQVCAISFQGRVACFDISQGNLLWSRDISSDKGMLLLRKFLYITDAHGALIALDKTTGSTLWKNDMLRDRNTTAPYVLGNFVVAGDYQGFLHGLNREDGSFVARISLDGSAILTAPVELGEGVLVQTRKGGLYSLSLH